MNHVRNKKAKISAYVPNAQRIPYGIKTIFITITRGSLVRNFFLSGVIPMLIEGGHKVVVLTHFHDRTEIFDKYKHPNLMIEPLLTPPTTVITRLMQEFFKGAIFNKTVHTRYLYRITAAINPPSKLKYIPRMIFFAPLRLIPGFRRFIRFVDLHIEPQRQNDYLFKKYNPDLVFSTTPHGSSDISVLKGAKRFDVRTVAMPKSWDTLSKLLFSVKTDQLLVWSPYNKGQALRYQGYCEKEIKVTGSPQFDYYGDKKNLVTREEFCKKYDFDPSKKIILYGSTGSRACYESHYVELIRKYIDNGDLPDAQVLIRPHIGYIGDADQFNPFIKIPGFIVDKQDKQDTRFKDNWDISEGHLSHLLNSLYHADVAVIVGSTLSIDATLCDTPVININFDARLDIDPAMSVKRLYKSDYISAIANIGGTYLATSERDYLDALKRILIYGERKKEGMKRLIKEFAYRNDGDAAKRTAEALQLEVAKT